MRMIRKGMIMVLALCLLLSAAAGAETYVAQNGTIPDQMIYPGDWRTAYSQILYNHMGTIRAYESRTMNFYENDREYNIPCKPVQLQDLTGDAIPELLFLETASTAEGETRGDLYIYSANGSTAKCVLYVPGITFPDYDEVGLGFSIYLSRNNGNTLVIEHYEYETPWTLQFFLGSSGRYELLNWMKVEWDASGEGEDRYYQNGWLISADAYNTALTGLQNGKYAVVSEYRKADSSAYGLDITWQNAVDSLGGSSSLNTDDTVDTGNEGIIYGWTIQKLATRKGPGTQYEEGGTYSVKNQYIQVLAKAYDKRNGIWWVKCVIPYHGEERILWTGYKRFDKETLSLDDLPEEIW